MGTDLSALDRVAKKIRKLSTPAFRAATMDQLAQVARQEMAKTRAAYSDPHGRPWRKTRSGSTGLSKLAPQISATATGVSVAANNPWVKTHQGGMTIDAKPGKWLVFMVGSKKVFAHRVKIAPRVIIPKSIPQRWLASFGGKLKATLHSTLNG